MSEQWKICGYDGDNLIFERVIPVGAMSEKEMTRLLERLASRHLTGDEVVSASLRENAGHVPFLKVVPNRGGTPGLMTTGIGPHYTAIVKVVPKGPKGEKRPGDVIGAAVRVMKIATGEIEDETTEDGKNEAAVELGRKGGAARAKKLSKKRRSEIAKKAARARWSSRENT